MGRVRHGYNNNQRSVRLSMEAESGGDGKEDGARSVNSRGLLRRIVTRVVKTGKTVGQKVREARAQKQRSLFLTRSMSLLATAHKMSRVCATSGMVPYMQCFHLNSESKRRLHHTGNL